MLTEINDSLLQTEPKLCLMFTKGKSYSSDKVPGYICVPSQTFKVKELRDYIRVQENINTAREFATKYIDGQRKYEKAHDDILKLIPKIKIARKNEKDYDIQKFSLAIIKLKKFLKKDDDEFDKVQILSDMIESSHSRQLIFSGQNQYKIYKDLSIEIPFNFDEEVLRSFFQ